MKKIALTILFAGTFLLASDGASLYTKCSICHGKNGEKTYYSIFHFDRINEMSASKLEYVLKGYRDGTIDLHGQGKLMQSQVSSLSDDDIKALAKYISSMK